MRDCRSFGSLINSKLRKLASCTFETVLLVSYSYVGGLAFSHIL